VLFRPRPPAPSSRILGDPALADRLEALAYNALPGTMTPDCWAHQYDQQSNQVLVTRARRDWTTNGDASNVYGLMPNYPCCLANMHQGWPKLVQHMWMATEDNGLAALVYGPNRVTATVGRGTEVTLIQETLYPFDGTVRLKMELPENCRFPLHLRIPGWAAGTTIQIGNKKDHPKAGTFVRINKEWKDGEEIILTLPMDVDVERRYRNSVAVRRGPLYFGLRIGKDYRRFILKERNFGSIKYKGSVDWEIRPATPWNYGLLLDEVNGDIFTVQTYPITHYPFADRDEMIFDTKQSKYKKWKQDAPVVLTVKARRIPDWQLKNNSADDPPLSPVHSDESLEKIHLVPYGCARIRISEFPVLE